VLKRGKSYVRKLQSLVFFKEFKATTLTKWFTVC